MPRLSEQELERIAHRHQEANRGLYGRHPHAPPDEARRAGDSLDDIPALVAALVEAQALAARYRAALQWCLDEGGWRLLEYELSGPPPAGVFDRAGHFTPKLEDEAVTVAALGLPGGPEPERSEQSEGGD
jgi:hypothetical protein